MKVIGFARTVGVSSIRASSIKAIAIMTNVVETNRTLGSHDDTGSIGAPVPHCTGPKFRERDCILQTLWAEKI